VSASYFYQLFLNTPTSKPLASRRWPHPRPATLTNSQHPWLAACTLTHSRQAPHMFLFTIGSPPLTSGQSTSPRLYPFDFLPINFHPKNFPNSHSSNPCVASPSPPLVIKAFRFRFLSVGFHNLLCVGYDCARSPLIPCPRNPSAVEEASCCDRCLG
jgi:hypothetical protein